MAGSTISQRLTQNVRRRNWELWPLVFSNFSFCIFHCFMVAIVQLVRTPGCGPGGRGFKSHWPPEALQIEECRLEIEEVGMNADDMKRRTKAFALRVISMADSIPRTTSGRVIAGQLVRASTSVGSNYRAACRSRSKAEFNSKLQTVQEEADESGYWIELLIEGNIVTASLKTARGLR
jgi:four helix bundle protein